MKQIIQGEFRASDEPALSRAIAQCYAVISLIGPVLGEVRSYTPTFFADIYAQQVLPLMIQHSVPRILAMSTVSVYRPEDSFSFLRWLNSLLIRLLFSTAQKNMFAVEAAFDNDKQAHELDWTVYRMVIVLGGCDEQTWQKDRAAGEMYAGPVGAKGFSLLSRRGQLACWLVDAALDKNGQWSQKMPAVSRVAGGKSSKAA